MPQPRKLICIDCHRPFKTTCLKNVERCPHCRTEHNYEVNRKWHRNNNHKYPYKNTPTTREQFLKAKLPTVGHRYAFYWELEA